MIAAGCRSHKKKAVNFLEKGFEMPVCQGALRGLNDYPWQYSYKTSSIDPHGRPVDILHDFYIPALRLSTQYDRVAGYFRSSSLAAASQGFSAFAAGGGKMRLVVGPDLEADNVAAVLPGGVAGDRSLNPGESGKSRPPPLPMLPAPTGRPG
jgi:hypothetical protein